MLDLTIGMVVAVLVNIFRLPHVKNRDYLFFVRANLGTGQGVSVKEVIETCRRVTGHPIPVKACPRRAGDPPALYASGRKAREVMGWNPVHSDIETIVRDAWAFHQAHPDGLEV